MAEEWGGMMARPRLLDYLQSHRFWVVDITPTLGRRAFVLNPTMGFSSVSGLGMTVETQQFTPGNSNWPVTIPIGASASQVTMSRGVSMGDSSFWDWVRDAVKGVNSPVRTLMVIHYTGMGISLEKAGFVNSGIALSASRIPGQAWVLWECVPVGFRGPSLDASTGDVSVQEIDIQPTAVTLLAGVKATTQAVLGF